MDMYLTGGNATLIYSKLDLDGLPMAFQIKIDINHGENTLYGIDQGPHQGSGVGRGGMAWGGMDKVGNGVNKRSLNTQVSNLTTIYMFRSRFKSIAIQIYNMHQKHKVYHICLFRE